MNKRILIIISFILSLTSNAQVVKVQVGLSKYDLQSNNSIERRIVVDPVTKKLVATFTGSSAGDGTYSDRCTGYAFWDGMTWKNHKGNSFTPPYDSFIDKLENKRVGWPNPTFIGGGEVVVSHIAEGTNLNGLFSASRTVIGTGAWNLKQISAEGTWPRVASSGNKMVAISVFGTAFNNVTSGIGIIKSTDGGATWSTEPDTIAGINVDNYTGIGGDNYHIDLKGDTIAILTGINDVTLYKSTNFGTTWTKKSFVPTSDNFSTDLSRAERSDGSYSVLIGNDGTVHCFWGRQVTFMDATQGTGTFIDGSRSGIMYWNENMGTKDPIVMPRTDFYRENSKSALTPFTRFNRTTTTGGQISYIGNGSGYNMNTTSWPSTGTDAAGNLYMTYAYNRGKIDTSNSGPGKDADINGFNLYDVMAMKSMDGGTTWTGPMNISSTATTESTYPSMARYVDDSLYVIWQEDSLYGNAVMTVQGSGNGTGGQAGPIHTNNRQFVAKAAVSAITNPASDITPPILMFKNSFIDIIKRKTLSFANLVVFKGCGTDTVTGKPMVASKKFLMDNIVEFRDDVNGMDTNYLIVDSLSSVKLNVAGVYGLRMWGKDAAGNISQTSNTGFSGFRDTLSIAIEVIEDVTPPTITLNGSDPMPIYLGTNFTDPGVIVSDNNPCTSASFTKSGTVDKTTPGTYTISYSATDIAGLSTTVTRKVVVGVEPTAVITNESLVGKLIKGSGSTSLNIITDANNSFRWFCKKGNTNIGTSLGSTAITNSLNTTLTSTFPAFDSLCLEVKNDFNAAFSKPVSRDCKYLKYTVGINSAERNVSVDIYPNPNNGSFNVKLNGNKSNQARFILTSLDGRTVLDNTVKINNNTVPFNTPMSKGTYFMTTEIDGNVYLDKIEVK